MYSQVLHDDAGQEEQRGGADGAIGEDAGGGGRGEGREEVNFYFCKLDFLGPTHDTKTHPELLMLLFFVTL